MAVAYRSGASAATNTASGVTVTAPAGVQAGDVLVGIVFADAGAINTPSGWSVVGSSSTYDFLSVFTRTATASEPTAYAFTAGGSGTSVVAHVLALTGAGAATATFGGSTTATASQVAPSVTPAGTGALLIAAFAMAGGSRTWTPPTGMTEVADVTDTWASLESSYLALSTATATGSKTATASAAAAYTAVSVLVASTSASPDATVSGATAAGTVAAPAGSVSNGSAVGANVTGQTATGTATAPSGTASGAQGASSIKATPEPEAVPPRVRLDVATSLTQITLYRVASDGTRTAVRSYDGGSFPVVGNTLTVYDSEAPLGQPVSYAADNSSVTNSGLVTVTAAQPWLVHPGVPSRSLPFILAAMGDRTYEDNQSVRYPLGRRFPIVAGDGRRKAATYQLSIYTSTLDDLGPLELLLSDLSPLLLQVPPAKGWGVTSEYVSIGKVAPGRVSPIASAPWRKWILDCTVRDRPAGGSQSDNTYGTSYAAHTTYGARHAAASTYGQAFNPQ